MGSKQAHKDAIAYADKMVPEAKGYESPPKCYLPEAPTVCRRWLRAYREHYRTIPAPSSESAEKEER